MVQYEAGIRQTAFGGLPGRSEWNTDLFVGGGLMFPLSERRALGVIYQIGGDGPVHSLGIRYARSLGHAARVDLTGGGEFVRRDIYSGNAGPRRNTSAGAFGEAALHANDFLTALVREETYFPSRDLPGRSRLLVGARLERVPAFVASAAAAALIGLVIMSFGGEGT